MKDILKTFVRTIVILLFATVMCENGYCVTTNQMLWTKALNYAEDHTSGRLKITQLKSHDLKDQNNVIMQMLKVALTEDNLKKLARHNIKHLERLDSTKSTSSFSLPYNKYTKEIFNAKKKLNEKNDQTDLLISDSDLYPMVKLMRNTIDKFLKLEKITISLRNIGRSRRQLQLTAQTTRQKFLELQGYQTNHNHAEAGKGINLCLILSYDKHLDSFIIHHFWDVLELRPRHFDDKTI